MSNIGHAVIEATGSPHDLAALAAHVHGTARGRSALPLSALVRPEPCRLPAVLDQGVRADFTSASPSSRSRVRDASRM